MNNQKLSFNKRILLVKKETFEGVTTSGELDKIKKVTKQGKTIDTNNGYYSLSTIEKHLFIALEKYDIDLEVEILKDKVIGKWYDCADDSDKIRTITIDFSRIIEVDRLQSMANIVQSEGAIKTYTRRYSLTAILGLPATDLIDSGYAQNTNNSQQQYLDQQKYLEEQKQRELEAQKQKEAELNKKITQNEIKRLMAIAGEVGKKDAEIKEVIKKLFNLDSKKDLTFKQFNIIIKRLQDSKLKQFKDKNKQDVKPEVTNNVDEIKKLKEYLNKKETEKTEKTAVKK